MPRFTYEAIDADGNKIVASAEAKDREALLINLHSRGLTLLRWVNGRQKSRSAVEGFLSFFRKRNLLIFTRDLSNLLKSGLPIDKALSVIARSTSDEWVKNITEYLVESLREGKSLSDAMSSKPEIFNDLYVNMIRVGEVGGVLPQVMAKLVEFLEQNEETKQFIISTSIYPSILMLVGFISIFVIMAFVVPRFASIFADMGQQIPLATKLLLSVSTFLAHWWWLIPILLCLAIVLAFGISKSEYWKERLEHLVMNMPFVGDFIINLSISRFVRTFGILILSGVPILKAISIAQGVINNHIIKNTIGDMYEKIKEGKAISSLMKREKIFPPMVVEMVSVGEETGKLGEMMVEVASDLERKIQMNIKSFLTLLEPMTILVMGVIIGGIVISMLMAILGINEIQF